MSYSSLALWHPEQSLLYNSCLRNVPRRHGMSFLLFPSSNFTILIFRISFIVCQIPLCLWKLPRLKPPCFCNSHTCLVANHQTVYPPIIYITYIIKTLENGAGVRLLELSKGRSGMRFQILNDNLFLIFFCNSCKKQFPMTNPIKYLIEGK